ncbi:hypothetical protein [Xylophilus sp. ASV27]|nr:hypothetical protein [Xylophilus sp. ASV27]
MDPALEKGTLEAAEFVGPYAELRWGSVNDGAAEQYMLGTRRKS